ncbi:MAG: excinuclease ABC subunit UvrA, partial [Planctomycetes bacterium]|nr:excinuclease ABC subunit UvrA [Planctomycetota bacterium]
MAAADWIIDLGPEAGDGGGTLVAEGTPEAVARVEASHTGLALRRALGLDGSPASASARGSDGGPGTATQAGAGPGPEPRARDLEVLGARQHNLKAVSVRIPRDSLTVITGVSGSGKTSLAFDTIFAEGQRRYLECLSTYARRFLGRMQAAEVDRISGLSPAIAIDQKSASSNPRSTVATITEVHDYLRLLYARVGKPHCPRCGVPLEWTTPSRLAAELAEREAGAKAMILAPIRLEARGGELLERARDLRSELLKLGFTRLLAGGRERQEIRLDEEGDAPVRRILAAARDGQEVLAVVDRVVVSPAAQSRIAGSLEQAFERGGGRAGVLVLGRELAFHTRVPSCPAGHMTLPGELAPSMFSYSSQRGACPRCNGLGMEERVDEGSLVKFPARPLPQALGSGLGWLLSGIRGSALTVLRGVLRARGVDPETPYSELSDEDRRVVLHGLEGGTVPVPIGPGQLVEATWTGLVGLIEEWVRSGSLGAHWRLVEHLLKRQTCSACRGGRLRPESLAVRLGGLNIQELGALTVAAALEHLARLELPPREARIAEQALAEARNRLSFLEKVGLGYITLDRPAGTLSGGEAQRIRLASQLGNRLAGVLYVLDEPTVGLHPRDTRRLIESLRDLRGLGNTVLLVEHDRETMEAADWIIDMGPGAGARGGEVVACGAPRDLEGDPRSVTGRYLARRVAADGARARLEPRGWLELAGVRRNNLAGIRAAFPLGVLTAVTGVSGSGKSSLVLEVLAEVVRAHLAGEPPPAGLVSAVRGLDAVRRLVVVDQKPLGRTPRSNPATYTGLWDHVRELFAQVPVARVRGYGPDRFSFNTGQGKCASCDGQGATLVEMHFLSDVFVACEECKGRRFNRETLAIAFKGRNVGEILDMEVDEACRFFDSQPRIHSILETMRAVGLGYVKLGQPANTLSGGEAQRVKLAAELVTREGGGTLYILDEPTTGLHFEDVGRLIRVLQALVEGGNTLVVIEHQLDVVRAADWVIDLGPEAGEAGGRVVAEGPPDAIARSAESHTGRCL